MAAYVCTIAGGKGGVGRTTTALNAGLFFVEEGYDTAVVDADLGMADAGTMLGVEPEATLHDVLAGTATVPEALTDAPGGVSFLGGERTLEAYADADAAEIGEVIETLRADHDVILVDSSAGIHHETTVTLGAADGIVLVTSCADPAIHDANKTARLAERVDGHVLGVVLTRVRDDAEFVEVRDRLDLPVLGAIPDADSIASDPLVDRDSSTPGAESYRELTSNLARVFFEGASPGELDPALEENWFDDQRSPEEDTKEEEDSDDSDDSDDVLGLFN
jgi:septum site-determining protein MinD